MDAIKIREYKEIVIVDLPARVVKGGEDVKLKSILIETIEKGKNLGVNMKATAFIDSGIVIALLAAEKRIRQAGKKIYLISPSEQARELLDITSLSRIIPIVENEKELLK